MSDISIIVITYNSEAFIKPCLDSVFMQGNHNLQVIVVDNGSKDKTVKLVKEYGHGVILIGNKDNFGACKARNQGISVSESRWVFSLDCDVVLEEDFLVNLLELANRAEENVGMLQPKILKMDKKTIYSCGISLSKLRRFHDIGKGKNYGHKFNAVKLIFGATSAAALYRKTMLEEIKEETGYFDERFFFLVEDVDLSWRAQRKGWKALFCPESICYHAGNSSCVSKKARQYICFRNRNLLIRKNEDMNIIQMTIIKILYDLPRLFYLLVTNGYVYNAFFKKKEVSTYPIFRNV